MNFDNILPAFVAVMAVTVGMLENGSNIVNNITPPLVSGRATNAEPLRVMAGERVLVPWELNKTTDCEGSAARVWRGQRGFYYVEASFPTAIRPTDGPEEFHILTKVPERVPPGDLSMIVEVRYQCDGKKPLYLELGPVLFEVFDPPFGD